MDNNKTKKFQEYQEKRYYEITKQAELNNVIDIQFINMINYFKTHEVVLMQKLDKNIFDYIYYNYDNIKLFLDINRFGVDVIYSLSYYGRRFIKENKI